MSILRVTDIRSNGSTFNDIVTHSNSGGTENGRLCRAFVNFNGNGTVAMRANFNVNSITDNGTGDYTVNFSNALSDANYTVSFGGQGVSSSGWWRFLGSGAQSVNGFTAFSYRFQTPDVSWTVVDTLVATLSFFR